jgi:hypothetical protein
MDWESIGGGGGAGLFAALATMLGWNRRLRTTEEDKQDKAICTALHAQIIATQVRTQGDLDYIRTRLDKIYDKMLNGVRHE